MSSTFENSFREKALKASLKHDGKLNSDFEELESLIEKLDLFSNNIKTSKNTTSKNSTFFSSLTKSINFNLNKTQNENFDKIAFKLYNKLTDVSKEFLNLLKFNNGENLKNEVFRFNFINLNICLANFFKFFQSQFQNYNEVHKNVIKNTPNFLKIFFKLFEENLDLILSELSRNYAKCDLIKSFLGFIAVIMQTQPNMLRPFEAKIENMLNKILISVVNCGQINLIDKDFINLTTSLYGYLVYLSNDINKKFPSLLEKCLNSLKFYLNLFEPISIKNKKNNNLGKANKNKNANKNIKEEIKADENINNNNSKNNKSGNNKEADFEYFFDEISESIARDCIKARNCIFLLFKLIKNLFKIINANQILDLNLKHLIAFTVKNLFKEFTNINNNDYIISGLYPSDYNLVINYLRFSALKMLKRIILIFTPYLNYFIPLFKDIAKKLTIYKVETGNANSRNNFDNFFEIKTEILKFVKILIEKFDLKINSFTKEYVNKMAIGEFCDLLICFLEKNDKTIVKIDKSYFKLGSIANVSSKAKNTGANKAKASVSLLDIAKQETYNSKLDIYSNEELEKLITCYIKIFDTYVKSETFVFCNDEEKSYIKAVIDLICFPAYAKFLFSLSESLKNKFVCFINIYICSLINSKKNSSDEVNIDEKLMFFLRNFYSNESNNYDLITTFNLIHNEKNLKIVTTQEKAINLSESFLDLNKKIKERFSEILSEREQSFTQSLNQTTGNIAEQSQLISNALPPDQKALIKTIEQNNSNKASIKAESENTALLGKKTLRNFQSDLNNNEQNNDLLFDKFVDTKQQSFNEIGMSQYKSKTSANFYLFVNKKTEKNYFLNNKKDIKEHKNDFEDEIENAAKEKKPFSLRFNQNEDQSKKEENLDLNEPGNKENKNMKESNNDKNVQQNEDDDDDEIDIPDII